MLLPTIQLQNPPSIAVPAYLCRPLGAAEWRGRIRVPAALEREVAIAPATPTDDDLAALALALHARVSGTGGSRRLVRTDEDLRALRKNDSDGLREAAKAALRKYDETVGVSASPTATYDAMVRARRRLGGRTDVADNSAFAARGFTPASRLVADLLRGLPPSAYLAMRPSADTVLSNQPVGEERALSGLGSALTNYESSQRAFAEWAARAGDRIESRDAWIFPKGEFLPGPRTLLLTVYRTEWRPVFGVAVYDGSGKIESSATLIPPLERPGKPTSLGLVKLPEEARLTLRRITPGDDEFRPAWLDPEAHDPLEVQAKPALLLYAKARGFDRLVAIVPDSILRACREAIIADTVYLDAVARALAEGGCETITLGRTLVVRPRDALASEALRVDRRPLGAFARRVLAGRADFDDLAAMHAAYANDYDRRTFFDPVVESMRRGFHLESVPGWSFPHALLATWGECSLAERRTLAETGILRLVPRAHDAAIRTLARANQAVALGGSDLARAPSRLPLSKGGSGLDLRRDVRTRLRRVALDGTPLFPTLDVDYVPLRYMATQFHADPQEGLASLERRYRFLWAQDESTAVTATVGGLTRLGPYNLSRRLAQGGPVELSKVPGLDLPRELAP